MQRLDPGVRADCLALLDAITVELPRRWRRRTGVPELLFTLPAAGAPVAVRPVPAAEYSAEGGYADEFSRWVTSFVHGKRAGNRCVALAYGDRRHARAWLPAHGAGRFSGDSRVMVRIDHAEHPFGPYLALPFTPHGLVVSRLRFDPSVHAELRRLRGT